MTKFIIGRKSGMTQLFDENGNVIPATVISCEPMYVLQNKTVETDGYKACKVGTGSIRAKLVNKPDAGQFKKADVEPKRIIREFTPDEEYSLGQEIKVSQHQASRTEGWSFRPRLHVSQKSRFHGRYFHTR